ncbi:MAG: DMT family transporter [Candidatus Izimaplasma sp.]|nr:DMT family transporter [Candidatus Izimaplasma bacterium]
MTDRKKGIISLIIAAFGFAMMSIMVKNAGDLPAYQKVFFRNLISMFLAIIMVTVREDRYYGRKENQKFLLLRSTFGTIGMLLFFFSIDNLENISDATMLNKLSTFFLIFFSSFFLHEKIKKYQFIAIIIAFLGSLLIIKPAFNFDIIPYLTSVLAAMFAGAAYTMLRVLGKKEKYYTVVLYFSTFSVVVLLPVILLNYHPMTSTQIIYLILTGVFATVGQFGTTIAYKFAPAKQISIFNYINVLFVALLGIPFFSTFPDIVSLTGYVIIFGASFYMFKKKQT